MVQYLVSERFGSSGFQPKPHSLVITKVPRRKKARHRPTEHIGKRWAVVAMATPSVRQTRRTPSFGLACALYSGLLESRDVKVPLYSGGIQFQKTDRYFLQWSWLAMRRFRSRQWAGGWHALSL